MSFIPLIHFCWIISTERKPNYLLQYPRFAKIIHNLLKKKLFEDIVVNIHIYNIQTFFRTVIIGNRVIFNMEVISRNAFQVCISSTLYFLTCTWKAESFKQGAKSPFLFTLNHTSRLFPTWNNVQTIFPSL